MTIFRFKIFSIFLTLFLLSGCWEAANSLVPLNDVARIIYSKLPRYEKFYRLNRLLSDADASDDAMIEQFEVAGFNEEKSDLANCRMLRFRSELQRGTLPNVVARFCGREGRWVQNGDPPVVY
jgi:hypothetical protein